MRYNYFLLTGFIYLSFFCKINSQTYILNIEDFELSGTDIPTSWSETGLSNDGIWSVGSNSEASSQYWNVPEHTQFAFTNDDACNCNKSTDRLILPEQDFTNYSENPVLIFDAFNDGAYNGLSYIEVSLDGGVNFSIIDTISVNLTQWQNNLQFDLEFAGEGSVIIAITYNDIGLSDSATNWASGLAVDNVSIIERPSCFSPSITSLTRTETSATIGWSSDSLATAFIFEIGEEGFNPDSEGSSFFYASNNNTYTFDGLTENTSYDIYIRSVCEYPDESIRSGPYTFRTFCDIITTSWSESWDNNNNCLWNFYDLNNDNFTWSTFNPFTGTEGNEQIINNYSPSSSDDYLMSPAFSCLSGVSDRVMFDCKNIYHQYGEQYYDTLIIGVYDDSILNFLGTLDVIIPDTAYTTYEYNLSNYVGQNIRFFIYSGVGSGTLSNGITFVDNITVDSWPPCPKPIDLTAITAITSADISWTVTGTESEWNIEYGETGFSLGDGNNLITSSNYTTINDLAQGTTYDIYVQANCGSVDGVSEWVGPTTFFMPSCVVPSGLVLTSIDSTSASISWTAGYIESTWKIEYGEFGFSQDSGTALTLDSNAYTITGLISGQTYEVYVQSYCGAADGYSEWIGPIEFTTLLTCTVDAPFTEDFTNLLPSCWNQESISDSLDWIINSGGTLSPGTGPTDDYNGGGNYLYVEMTGSSYPSEAVMYTESYDISNLTNPELKFFAHMTGLSTGTLKINMLDDDNVTEIFSVSGDRGNNWMEYTVVLNPTSSIISFEIIAQNDTAYFATPAGEGPHTWMGDIAIDEFGIYEKPSCYEPYNISLTNVNSSSVSFEWNTNSSINSWNYVVVEQGQDPYSITSQTISSDSIVIFGLTQATNYDFYVQSFCGTSWEGPFSFSTVYPDDYGCLHTIKMYDSYGDGWNGGSIDIAVNGIMVINSGSIDISGSENGNEGSLVFGAQEGDNIQISNFIPGSYPEEISFQILDGGGSVIFESGFLNDDTIINSTVYGLCPENDLKVINSIVPNGCDLTNNEVIEIWVTNLGIAQESGFSLSYQVNSGIEITETINDTLNPNDTLKYVFTNTVDMSIVGQYEFILACNLTSDIYNENDSIFTIGLSTQSPNTPETSSSIICLGDTTQIYVTPSSSFTIWYDSFNLGNIQGYGDKLEISDTVSNSYFAESRAVLEIFNDDFESYIPGDSIAQSSEVWEAWNSGPDGGGDDDAQISDTTAANGNNSLVFIEGDDIVLPLSNESMNNGILTFEMDMNVGSIGYFNFQTDPIAGVGWAFEVVFINDTVSVIEGQTNSGLFGTYPGPGIWFNISLALDIDNGLGQLFINDESQGLFQFSSSIGGVNFYAPSGVNYAIDNLSSSFVTNCKSLRSEAFVTVGNTTLHKDSIVTCDSIFTWIDGNDYYQSNDSATYTFQSILGCDSIIQLDLTMITNKPEVNVNVTDLSCFQSNDGTAQITINGGTEPYTYVWSNGSITQNIENLSSGFYEITLSDANGCLATESINIEQPDELSVTVSVTEPNECQSYDGVATATVSGGYYPYTYVWNNGLTTSSIDNLSLGLYSVTITDSIGCSITSSNSINSSESPEIIIDSIANVSCFNGNDGAINVSVIGGVEPYLYNWNNGLNTLSIDGISSGTYILTVTDSNGCIVTESIEVLEPNAISIEYIITNPSGCGAQDGELTANAIGGISPYDYNWENSGNNSATISDLSQGIFNITVSGSDGCTSSGFVSLSAQNAPEINFTIENETCFGLANGSILANISGGSSPYTFNWDNGLNTQVINDLTSGNYFLTVTDSNNCQVSETASVSSPEKIEISYYVSDFICEGQNNGTIWGGVVSGGIPPFSYVWASGENTSSLENLAAGTYNLVVSDLTNCFLDTTFSIDTANIPLNPEIYGDSISEILSTNQYYVSGNNDSYYYWMVENGEITSPQGDSLITIQWDTMANGLVSVIETSSNGCFSDTVSFNVNILNSTGVFNHDSYFINAYPNPSNGEFTIITYGINGNINYEVYDLSGRLIIKGNKRTLSLLNYPDGIYFLKIYSPHIFDELRLIKNRQ